VPAATTAHTTAFFLPAESFPAGRPHAAADFELALIAAASIATALAERGNPVGLYANTRSADTGDPAAVPPSAARDRLPALLESLAKMTPRPGRPFGAFLEDQTRFLPAGTTVVLIVGGHPPDGIDRLTARLAVAGFQRAVLWVGDCEGCALADGTPQRRIRTPEDLMHGGAA
jgi:type IV secretory pathway protease TraF